MEYKMEPDEVAAMYAEAHLYSGIDHVVDLMVEYGSEYIMNLLYDRYCDVAYAAMQKKYNYEV